MRLDVARFLMKNGANVDIPDGDGSKARRTAAIYPQFRMLIAEYDEALRIDDGCAFCRAGGIEGKGKAKVEDIPTTQARATLRCGKCRNIVYCSARCQKVRSLIFLFLDFIDSNFSCFPLLVGLAWT